MATIVESVDFKRVAGRSEGLDRGWPDTLWHRTHDLSCARQQADSSALRFSE